MELSGNLVAHVNVGTEYHSRKEVSLAPRFYAILVLCYLTVGEREAAMVFV